MEYRTIIRPEVSDLSISYKTPLFFIGSCFSEEIGSCLEKGKFDVAVNPFGIMYNPVSVADTIRRIVDARPFTKEELYKYDNRYISFSHDTSFSSDRMEDTLEIINRNLESTSLKFKSTNFLFITFGTARIFRYISTNKVVANCHKIPSEKFNRELLDVDYIVEEWKELIEQIRSINKEINIIFTVSPVRHWKDGAHGNQISKSILFLAIDKMISADDKLSYFPSYELVLDDLRDYRFYKDDMLHPSSAAVNYIWKYFTSCYFNDSTLKLYSEIEKISTGKGHRISGNNKQETEQFKDNMVNRILSIEKKFPFINLDDELKYFQSL